MSGAGDQESLAQGPSRQDEAPDPPLEDEDDDDNDDESQAPSTGVQTHESAAANDSKPPPNTVVSSSTSSEPGDSSVPPPECHTQGETTPTGDQATPPEDAPSPQPVFRDDWSCLGREEVVDRVRGVIYGQAIGDALGLGAEFMTKKEVIKYYGKLGPENYSQIVQDFHRSRWEKGDWTDDTDQMLLILQMIVESRGKVDRCEFARKMVEWRREGFPDLGDSGGMGVGMTVSQTVSHGRFLTDPHSAAVEVWERSGRYLAANGAIMRTSILGVLEFNSLARVVANTREVCLTTHADPRCLASCVAVTTAIALMLQGKYNPQSKKDLEQLVSVSLAHGNEVLEHKDQKEELEKHMRADKLKHLDLENRSSMGYTFKALGAGFYGLRTATDFLPTLRKVIAEAGDADSNGAVCGALLGCRFGFRRLPQELLAFPHREWLDRQVDQFLATVGLKEQ